MPDVKLPALQTVAGSQATGDSARSAFTENTETLFAFEFAVYRRVPSGVSATPLGVEPVLQFVAGSQVTGASAPLPPENTDTLSEK
jgi:hypothetical protein